MPDGIWAVTVPKWGLSMEEGAVVEWLASEGARVSRGDEIVSIETSKIAGVVECPATGVLRKQVANIGDVLPVGAMLGVVADESADAAAIDAFIAEFQANFVPEEAAQEAVAPELERVELGPITLRYRAVAPTNAEAIPVVLVHGFGGDSNTWLFNADALAKDRPVYALDLPGHGASSKDVGDGSVDSLASTVVQFLDALKISRAHLAGHSLGAAIVLAVAAKHPARVASMAAIAPCGFGPAINMEYIDGFIRAERNRDMKNVLTLLFADPKLVTRKLADDVLKTKRIDGATDCLRAIAASAFPDGKQAVQFQDRLAEFSAPLLTILGKQDRVVGMFDGDSMHVIETAGHMPQMEAANDVNELLAQHFAGAR